MCSRGPAVCVYFVVSVVHGSGVFTRSMIKMPDRPYPSSATQVTQNTTDNEHYELIHPIKLESNKTFYYQRETLNGERTINIQKENVSNINDNLESNLKSPLTHNIKPVQDSSDQSEHNNDFNNGSDIFQFYKVNTSTFGTIQDNTLHDADRVGWNVVKNISFDTNGSNRDALSSGTKSEKGFPELNFWIVLQKFFSCGWSSEWRSCLQESFGATSDGLLFLRYLLVPSTPAVEIDEESSEEYVDDNEDSDLDRHYQIEGRKRFSKKLQSLIPLLLMLKMSMVPALALMALMTGKAFLVSLISLGVALFSALFSPAGVVSASKRQEIAPQSPIPPDQTSSNYYYMM